MEIIKHNTDKNGIEIVFEYHVTDDIKKWLRENSFRWSKRQGIWWRPFSVAMWTKVHEYFKRKAPDLVKNNICKYCGKEIKNRGMGGHLKLAHGIVMKRVMTVVSKQGEIIERSVRPSAQVPVMVKEQRTEVRPAPKPTLYDQRPDLIGNKVDEHGRITCPGCGIKIQPGNTHTGGYCHFCHNGIPNPHVQHQIDWENGNR